MTNTAPPQTQPPAAPAPTIEILGKATDLTANARGNQAEGNNGRTG